MFLTSVKGGCCIHVAIDEMQGTGVNGVVVVVCQDQASSKVLIQDWQFSRSLVAVPVGRLHVYFASVCISDNQDRLVLLGFNLYGQKSANLKPQGKNTK